MIVTIIKAWLIFNALVLLIGSAWQAIGPGSLLTSILCPNCGRAVSPSYCLNAERFAEAPGDGVAWLGMRALLCMAAIVSVLLIFDAAANGGRLWQTAWRDAQIEVHMFSYNLYYIE
jgi:hypothetical protein